MTGAGGRAAEPPVYRLQLRPLRPERRELLPLHLRHQVERGDVVRRVRQGPHVDEGERVQPGGGVVAAAGLQHRGDLQAWPHRLGEQLEQDLVLAREVVVQRRLPDADALGDLPGRRRGEALADEEPGRRVEYLLAWRDLGIARRPQPGAARAPPVLGRLFQLARRWASRVRHASDYLRPPLEPVHVSDRPAPAEPGAPAAERVMSAAPRTAAGSQRNPSTSRPSSRPTRPIAMGAASPAMKRAKPAAGSRHTSPAIDAPGAPPWPARRRSPGPLRLGLDPDQGRAWAAGCPGRTAGRTARWRPGRGACRPPRGAHGSAAARSGARRRPAGRRRPGR